jgi:hypothetical protein
MRHGAWVGKFNRGRKPQTLMGTQGVVLQAPLFRWFSNLSILAPFVARHASTGEAKAYDCKIDAADWTDEGLTK